MVIASKAWLTSATKKPGGNIAAEVQEIYSKNTKENAPVVVLPVDAYESLKDFQDWSWSKLKPNWESRAANPLWAAPFRRNEIEGIGRRSTSRISNREVEMTDRKLTISEMWVRRSLFVSLSSHFLMLKTIRAVLVMIARCLNLVIRLYCSQTDGYPQT